VGTQVSFTQGKAAGTWS